MTPTAEQVLQKRRHPARHNSCQMCADSACKGKKPHNWWRYGYLRKGAQGRFGMRILLYRHICSSKEPIFVLPPIVFQDALCVRLHAASLGSGNVPYRLVCENRSFQESQTGLTVEAATAYNP